jgi:hypothetical protein
MKTKKIRANLDLSTSIGIVIEIAGYIDRKNFPGIAICINPRGNYQLAHIKTGQWFLCDYKSKEDAVKAARKLSKKWDWDFGSWNINWNYWEWTEKGMGKKVRKIEESCGGAKT